MTDNTQQTTTNAPSLVRTFADRYSVEPGKLLDTLKNTAFKQSDNQQVSDQQMMALLVVANQYKLNPFTKEIYAFPSKGGIQPIVSIDGWMKIINDHPEFDGMKFKDHLDEGGKLTAVTCCIYRKDRTHPIEVTEYLSECSKGTEPWKKWPARMLRHKAAIQCARYAFSFSGIVDPDEAERIIDVSSGEKPQRGQDLPAMSDEEFSSKLPTWQSVVESGKKVPDEIITMLSSKYALTEGQRQQIRDLDNVLDAEYTHIEKEDENENA